MTSGCYIVGAGVAAPPAFQVRATDIQLSRLGETLVGRMAPCSDLRTHPVERMRSTPHSCRRDRSLQTQMSGRSEPMSPVIMPATQG